MRFLRRSLVGLFLVSVTLGALAFAGQMLREALLARWAEEDRPRPARERVIAVNVQTVTPEAITPVLSTFGEIRSRRTLELRAPSAGTVVDLAEGFEEGGAVRAGTLLMRVDPSDAQSALEVAQTDLTEAEAELREAGAALELAVEAVAAAREQLALRSAALTRQRGLNDRGVGTEAAVETAAFVEAEARGDLLQSRQSLIQAEARADQAKTALARVRITLAEAERTLAETELFAEFSGTLSDVAVVKGGLVQNNERLAQLVDPEALEVVFRVSNSEYLRLLDSDGALLASEVEVVLDVLGVDLSATGTISRESAVVGEGLTGRQLFARIGKAPGLRSGDFVRVAVREPELQGVARLPATALDAAETVLVLGPEDRLRVMPVELLRRQGDTVIVRAPDLAGQEVVAERSPLLGAGIRVRPIRRAPDGAANDAPDGANAAPAMVELSAERRARLVAFVEGNKRMPAEAKQRVLQRLQAKQVPASMIERLESRMGG